MKKETTNTFNKGMVKDLHPLTTPNDVLTDALNATLITYNGNENVLQNDIGNIKIQQAFLKSGYVPVGMKEHGGIIYVAAYNPKTGKGQVGSFPSPQQLWEDEKWTINAPSNVDTSVSIPSGSFYEDNKIKNEIVKKEIFTNQQGEARTFHPGDKFIVKLANKGELTSSVNAGYLSVQLGVIKSDGGIEIMKTWDKDNSGDFLYDGNASNLKNELSTSKAQVFDASSSGQMLIIFNLHTLDTFNLVRNYSLDNEDNIVVTFTGEGTKDGVTYNSKELNGYLKLSNGTNYDQDEITITGTTGITSIDIYPNVPFGIVDRMKRSVSLNFDKIRTKQDEFGEWRFFVMPTYMKIGWAYDFYNLDKSKEIDYIRMYFHKLEDGYTTTNKEALPHVDFQKEYYSGNFEDYINYSDIGLKYRNIYIVEIVKKFKDTNSEETIDFKMLYLSQLYNSQYNGFYKNNSIGNNSPTNQPTEFTKISDQSVSVKFEHELNTELANSKTQLLRPGDSDFENEIDTASLKSSMYINDVSTIRLDDLDDYQYVTRVKNTQNGVLNIKCILENLDDKYIGKPRATLINDILNAYTVEEITIESKKEWNKGTNLPFSGVEDPTLNSPTLGTSTVTNGCLQVPINNIIDYRIIQGKASDVQTTSYVAKGLQPLYSQSYTTDRKNKLAPYWNVEASRCIGGAGEDENGIFHNCTITKSGTIIEGLDSGGGFDDGGLQTASNMMSNPMTNIFSGIRGQEAELCFDGTEDWRNDTPDDGWEQLGQGGESDGLFLNEQSDNYLIACWKFTDGDTKFVNMITPRSPRNGTSQEDFVTKRAAWPRLDVIMRCILSQIFVVNKINKTAEYIIPDQRFYRYQEGKTKLTIKLTGTPTNQVLDDIMVSEEGIPLNDYLTTDWGYDDQGRLFGQYPMQNLIPNVKVANPSLPLIEIEIPDYYELDNILKYYLGVTYTQKSSDEGLDPKLIYQLDITDTSSLVVNIGGDYEWKDIPKCKPITSTDKDLYIYRWNSTEKIKFPNFYNRFVTKAKMNDWNEVPEGEDNEIYAQSTDFKYGVWTNGDHEDAPDLYYKVLYSPAISPFKKDNEFEN